MWYLTRSEWARRTTDRGVKRDAAATGADAVLEAGPVQNLLLLVNADARRDEAPDARLVLTVGAVRLRLVEELRALGVHVEEPDGAEPVGAIVLGRLGRLPRVHDTVSLGGATFEVTSLSRRRVTRVRVRPLPPPSTPQ